MKQLLASVVAAAMLLVSAQGGFAATNNKVILSDQNQQQLVQNMAELGIDHATQEKLIKKIKRGEMLDSMNPEKIKQVEDQLQPTHSQPIKKQIFPDGSVLQQSLTGDTSSCGTGYCNYRGVSVERNAIGFKASFLANYTIVYGAFDSISNVYDPKVSTLFTTVNSESLTLPIPQESVSNAAQATYRIMTSSTGGHSSATYFLKFFVGNNQAWQSATW